MIINPVAPGGHTIFCDDIRHEVTGKTTLVGVYNNHLVITGTLPVTLPQIFAAITLRLTPPDKPIRPVVKIFRSDEAEPIFVIEADIEPTDAQLIPTHAPNLEPDAVTFMQMGFAAQIQGLVIDKPFALKVRAFIGDDEVRLGSLQIMVQSTPPELHASALAPSLG